VAITFAEIEWLLCM